jgi:hypothetical protein
MTDYVASLIRTYAPAIVAGVLAYLADVTDITNINSPENVAKVVAGIFVVYYAAVRLAEKKWPKAGWLLFLAKKPNYPAPPG